MIAQNIRHCRNEEALCFNGGMDALKVLEVVPLPRVYGLLALSWDGEGDAKPDRWSDELLTGGLYESIGAFLAPRTLAGIAERLRIALTVANASLSFLNCEFGPSLFVHPQPVLIQCLPKIV